jgi:hypothetical protein
MCNTTTTMMKLCGQNKLEILAVSPTRFSLDRVLSLPATITKQEFYSPLDEPL